MNINIDPRLLGYGSSGGGGGGVYQQAAYGGSYSGGDGGDGGYHINSMTFGEAQLNAYQSPPTRFLWR